MKTPSRKASIKLSQTHGVCFQFLQALLRLLKLPSYFIEGVKKSSRPAPPKKGKGKESAGSRKPKAPIVRVESDSDDVAPISTLKMGPPRMAKKGPQTSIKPATQAKEQSEAEAGQAEADTSGPSKGAPKPRPRRPALERWVSYLIQDQLLTPHHLDLIN
jgi:hypothetical protein